MHKQYVTLAEQLMEWVHDFTIMLFLFYKQTVIPRLGLGQLKPSLKIY